MILSSLCATSGIIVGILAFAQQPTFTRLSRPFSAGIMFFASSEWTPWPLARPSPCLSATPVRAHLQHLSVIAAPPILNSAPTLIPTDPPSISSNF